jgi:hypothetical protein
VRSIKLLFNECLGKPVVLTGLKSLIEATTTVKFEFAHLQDYYEQGVKDKDFIPEMASHGWIMVTADRGGRRRRRRDDVLPFLCRQFGMTHILIGATIHAKPQREKAIALATVWEDIVNEVATSREGSRWILRAGPAPHHHPFLEFREQ